MLDVFKIPKLRHLSTKNKTALSLYPWKNCKPDFYNQLQKPLTECNVAIVSSAGLYDLHSQETFDSTILGGDYSYRIIPSDINMNSLREGHRSDSFDHEGIRGNSSTGLPIPQLNALVKEGYIGKINYRHFSIMGSITAPARFIKNTVPDIAKYLKADHVDVVLLVPV